MKTIYEAEDGKQFNTIEECQKYEDEKIVVHTQSDIILKCTYIGHSPFFGDSDITLYRNPKKELRLHIDYDSRDELDYTLTNAVSAMYVSETSSILSAIFTLMEKSPELCKAMKDANNII